jgi:hypothetical protein
VLTRTEGLTDAMGSENPLFRSVFNHIAPWIVGTEFVQENAAGQMNQISLNYRESPLSVSHHPHGSLRGGDRVPNLNVHLIGGQAEPAQASKEDSLFHMLNTDRFTLFLANLKDAEATLHTVQSSLSPWQNLLQTCSIAPARDEEEQFNRLFGSEPSLILVRPDGYISFLGPETSVDALAQYLNDWFPARKDTVEDHATAPHEGSMVST